MRDIFFVLLWMGILGLSFYAAHLGVLVWIWIALLAPSDLMYGMAGSVPLNKMIAASTLLLFFSSREKKQFYFDGLLAILAAFSVVFALSYFFELRPLPKADDTFDKFWKMLLLCLLITGSLYTRHRLHQAALAIALGFGFVMVKEGLIFLLTAGGHKVLGTPATGDNNGLALAMLMIIPFMLYCARYTEDKWIRLGMYAAAALGAVAVIATYSRVGFLGLLVLGVLLLKGNKHKVRTLILLSIAAVALYAVMPDDYMLRIDTIKTADADNSFMTRVISWKINFLIALDHPLLGGGPFASLDWVTWIERMGTATTLFFPTEFYTGKTLVAHSIYFQALGDTGFVGFALFFGMLGTAVFYCGQIQRVAKRNPELAWAGDLARALQVSFLVYCAAGAALSLNYFELVYIMIAVVSRLHQTVLEQTAPARGRVPMRAVSSGPLAPAYARRVL